LAQSFSREIILNVEKLDELPLEVYARRWYMYFIEDSAALMNIYTKIGNEDLASFQDQFNKSKRH